MSATGTPIRDDLARDFAWEKEDRAALGKVEEEYRACVESVLTTCVGTVQSNPPLKTFLQSCEDGKRQRVNAIRDRRRKRLLIDNMDHKAAMEQAEIEYDRCVAAGWELDQDFTFFGNDEAEESLAETGNPGMLAMLYSSPNRVCKEEKEWLVGIITERSQRRQGRKDGPPESPDNLQFSVVDIQKALGHSFQQVKRATSNSRHRQPGILQASVGAGFGRIIKGSPKVPPIAKAIRMPL
ncbi:MAG: hypothetical protein M1823_004662 [Watsoniomyces obsoletus]|nr:MAG: hypothetical protein M1823_004662 [Watsoniomyces obsoletus]